MMNCIQSSLFLVLFSLLLEVASGSNCSVDSSDKAIVSGDSVSVRCMTDGTLTTITEWRLNNGTSNDPILIYNKYLYETTKTSLANGYFVVNPSGQQSTLYVNHTVLSNAGIYYCICVTVLPDYTNVKDNVSANVIILDDEPWFKQTTAINNGMQTVTCNIAFRGIANSYILIQDISGNNQKGRNDTGAISALNNFTLDYSITSDANVNLIYMCNITLRNLLSQTIYSKSLITSVEWAVHNVRVSTDAVICVTHGLCALNQTIRCVAEGNPKPDGFQWTVSINESNDTVTNDGSDQFILHMTGLYKIQCTAFNTVMNISYNASSAFFVTNVTTFGPTTVAPDEASKIGLIVGLVVGLSILLIIILIITIFILKRTKRRTACCNTEDQKHQTRTETADDKELKNNGKPNQGYEPNGTDETTLVDNDLYSGNKRIDPSDGGYASVNEVNSKR